MPAKKNEDAAIPDSRKFSVKYSSCKMEQLVSSSEEKILDIAIAPEWGGSPKNDAETAEPAGMCRNVISQPYRKSLRYTECV